MADYLWKNVSLVIEEGTTSNRKSGKMIREIAVHIVQELNGQGKTLVDCQEIIQRNLRVEHYAIGLVLPDAEFEKLCYVLVRTRREDVEEFLGSVFDAEFNQDVLNSFSEGV